MDKVFIKDLEIETIIGIFGWEREVKQIVKISLEMSFDISKAGKSDQIEDALDYKKIGKSIVNLVENSSFFLVEKMAEEIAKLVLKNKQIKDNIDSYYSKKTTAARKVWYQDQDIEKMEYIEYILKIFYYGIFIAYIIFSGFIKNAEYKNKKIVLLLIVYLVIPFILDNIITFILELINNYYNKAPS